MKSKELLSLSRHFVSLSHKKVTFKMVEEECFNLFKIIPCADNEDLIYLEGVFEIDISSDFSEWLRLEGWSVLIIQSNGVLTARKDGMLIILNKKSEFYFSNANSEEEAKKTLIRFCKFLKTGTTSHGELFRTS